MSEQEPVACDWEKVHEVLCDIWSRCISADEGFDAIQDLIYAAPVRTKDLTDDEAQKLWHDTSSIVPMWAHHLHFARAVIAADREKNK